MPVLAEGVETKEQKEWLEEHGCDFLQGYYFSRPIPQEEYLEYLENAINENPEKYVDVFDYRKKKDEEEKIREE
jgi:sensor c-di-GMP phosphodiesterase-like protein